MSYSNTVSLLNVEGGDWPEVTARLWMMWEVLGTGSGAGPKQSEQESITLQSSATFTVAFNRGPSNSNVMRGIGLSLQDRARVANDTGWWFRSGRFWDDLPNDPIEIVLASPVKILRDDLPLPSPPFPLDSVSQVTELTAKLVKDGIDFTAVGTTTRTGVVVGFRYAGTLLMAPSSSINAPADEPLSISVLNPTIVFLPGPSVLSAVEAELMNVLRVFIMRELGPQIARGIERTVNVRVLSSVGKELPGEVLPDGVILSVRSISITPDQIEVRAALGAFGGVLSRLPDLKRKPFGIDCFIATAAYGPDSEEVLILRDFRDRCLAPSPVGRQLVWLYERISPGPAALISRRPFLKSLTRTFVVAPAVWLAKRRQTNRSI